MIPVRLRVAVVCATFSLVAACSAAPATTQDASTSSPEPAPSVPATGAPSPPPGPDEVVTSPNVKLVANVPRTAPLDSPNSWNSDLAFQGDYAYVGNFGGFAVYDISDPTKPQVVSQVACPSQQNDISVHGDLLILSIDEARSGETCDSESAGPDSPGAWEGLRIFDISDKKNPRYVSAVKTACGSHTHTTVQGKNKDSLYVYISSPGPEPGSATCPSPHPLLQVVEIPVKDPGRAKIVAKPDFIPEGRSADSGGGCHDITAYPEKNLAAAACFGDGWLLDIADPLAPKVLQQVSDRENFQIWHSATFNNDATKVVFSDELGGGGMATCDSKTPNTKGANAIYDIVSGKLERRGYFKMPREQTSDENCVAHNGSLLPIDGKDVMVQAWYQGGVSIWDFTDSDRPREVGFFDRGPVGESGGIAGSWSAYYYNGYIYSSDILKGLDILDISDPLTDPAKTVKMGEFNIQTQKSY
ncbi:hypothetical protein [Nonomuraea longicatena]|uniref:LVIVD repeat-containing protein n=1 Tax=Nonomuraea longicatena TaxID=83682 RepID=UPI0031E31518